jgi:adenylate cyclase
MMLSITYLNSNEHAQVGFAEAPIMIGSSRASLRESGVPSFVIVDDSDVEPVHCQLDQDENGVVTLTNFGSTVVLETGPRVFRNKVSALSLPCSLRIGETHIQIHTVTPAHQLDGAIVSVKDNRPFSGSQTQHAAPDESTVSAWFEAIGELNRSVAGSEEFFQAAAKTLFRPGGLDGAMILKRVDDQWTVVSSHLPYPEYSISFREDLVSRCELERTTLYHDSKKIHKDAVVDDVQSVIVCPIFGETEQVDSVIYGFRNQHRTNSRRGIRRLEVKFVQLIASSIATALIRLDREAKAAQDRVLLEQAFSPKVAQQLGAGQLILRGRTQEVSVLFADLRGFTRISERIGTELTYELLTEVMDAFSQVIADEDGVIIDFYGDGLSAFWNAPLLQPNHPELACRAALKIASAIDPISRRWAARLGQRLRVGIGLNCGMAQVGNSGSSSRLKYGPQGPVVNLTSRLENVTKDIGVSIVASDSMVAAVKNCEEFSFRRLCNSNLSGTRTVTGLFQLIDPSDGFVPSKKYESALRLFEASEFSQSVSELTKLQLEFEIDFATEFLLKQSLTRTRSNIDRRALESAKNRIVALTHNEVAYLLNEGICVSPTPEESQSLGKEESKP